MVVIILSLIVPLTIYFALPSLLEKIFHQKAAQTPLLLVACLVFFISWYLPQPLIEGRDTSFTTHFVGGGLFCGLLWLYLRQTFNWRPKNYRLILETASLYALVSALGAFNELFEIFGVKIGLLHIPLDDTSWDIVANTLGALAFYIPYRLFDFIKK